MIESIELELLNHCVAKNTDFLTVKEAMTSLEFSSKGITMLFEKAHSLVDKSMSVDWTVLNYLMRGQAEESLSSLDASRCAPALLDSESFESKLRLVKLEASKRKSVDIMREHARRILSTEINVAPMLADAANELDKLANSTMEGALFQSGGDAIAQMFKTLAEENKEKRMLTGIHSLDDRLHSLGRGQVTILGARTHVGKTMLAQQFAIHAASQGFGVYYATVEMQPHHIVARMLGNMAAVDSKKILKKTLTKQEFEKLTVASKKLKDMPIKFHMNASMRLSDIYCGAQQAKREFKKEGTSLGLVVVDHIGIVEPEGSVVSRPRNEQVKVASRGMKTMSAKLDCHVLALSQLNRKSEEENVIPSVSNLSESTSLEQDADNIILFHREKDSDGIFEDRAPARVILAKNRVVGDIGMSWVRVIPEFQTVRDLTDEEMSVLKSIQKNV